MPKVSVHHDGPLNPSTRYNAIDRADVARVSAMMERLQRMGGRYQLAMRPVNERKVRVNMWFRRLDDAVATLRALDASHVTYAAVYAHQPWVLSQPVLGMAFVSHAYAHHKAGRHFDGERTHI